MYYKIDKENRKVVATVMNCWGAATDYIMSEIKTASGSVPFINMLGIGCIDKAIYDYCSKHIQNTYSGTATCNEEDTFDEETGKRIARARALKKYYKALSKIAQEISGSLYCMSNAADEMVHASRVRRDAWITQEKIELNKDYMVRRRNKHTRYYTYKDSYISF